MKADTTGLYLLTTHSPVVLRELSVDDLHVVHCRAGLTEVVSAAQPGITDLVQGRIRAGAEAFLAPKVIVCEGATEAGVVRGLDDSWIAQGLRSFAYQGVAVFSAGSGKHANRSAIALRELHYDVAVVVDSDAQAEFSDSDAAALRDLGVHVAMWDGGLSIEERAFADMSWTAVLASYNVACELLDRPESLMDQIRSHRGSAFVADRTKWTDDPGLRAALGQAANAGGWFKQVGRGKAWAAVIMSDCVHEHLQGDLYVKIRALRQWIDRD